MSADRRADWPLADRIAYLAGRVDGAADALSDGAVASALRRDADELEKLAREVRHYVGNTPARPLAAPSPQPETPNP